MNDRTHEEQLEMESLDAIDGLILGAVRSMFEQGDPPPAGLAERAKFATTVRALEAEVAQLLRHPLALATHRADASAVETITFTSRHLTVMVSVTDAGIDHVRVDGWVTGGGVRVELRNDVQVRTTTTDAEGRFVFDRVPRGMAQFVLHRVLPDGGDEQPVVTPAVVL